MLRRNERLHVNKTAQDEGQRLKWRFVYLINCNSSFSDLGGLGVSMLASGTHVCWFEPGQSRRSFQGEKILSMPSFEVEVKPSVPCRRFAACKRSLQITWNSSKLTGHFWPIVPPLPARGLLRHRHGAPGGTCGNFQSRARTICSTSGGTSHRGPVEEEEEELVFFCVARA
jgi:hypothetical protein